MSPQAKTPEQREKQRAEAAAAYVDVAFDDAFEIRENQAELNDTRKANREQLRQLRDQGHLNDEQAEMLEELYPTRTRATAEEDTEENQDDQPGAE